MTIGTSAATAATVALIKNIIDDIYVSFRKAGINRIGKSRSEIKEPAVARALLTITKVKTLWNIEKEASLYDFYYPSTIEFSDNVAKRVNRIRDFGPSGHFVIQGTAGQGKSIFLRFLCGQELQPDHTSGRIPIFVELRRISSELSVKDLILQGLERFKLPATEESWKYLAGTGKFVLLLDAFDEIDRVLTDKAIADIEAIAESFREHLQIIITSRPDSDIEKSNQFRVFRLAQLKASDHAPFLKKICVDPEQSTNLLKILARSTSDVSGLLTTPLMMTLLVILYKSLQTIPDTVPKFYEELFDVLFYRHDHSKPGFRRKRFTQLEDGAVKHLFSALCFFVRLRGFGALSNKQLAECCTEASKACSISVDFQNFKSELVKTICLMQEEGFEISFIHKSVAQYYAASFVSRSGESFATAFYDLARRERGWELELRFLREIDSFRFHKFYELPLLYSAAANMNISIENPSDTDLQSISDFFFKKTLLVSADVALVKHNELDSKFIGWGVDEHGLTGKQATPAFSEFASWWASSTVKFLNDNNAPLFTDEDSNVDQTMWVPASRYREFMGDASLLSAKLVIDTLRERVANAVEIVDSESRKTAMLAAFLQARAEN